MSEKPVKLAGAKPDRVSPSTKYSDVTAPPPPPPRRAGTQWPSWNRIIASANLLAVLAYLYVERDSVSHALYRHTRGLLGLDERFSVANEQASFYALCTEGGNRIYTSEDGGEYQCILVNNGVIAGLGHQSELETLASELSPSKGSKLGGDSASGLEVYYVPEGGIVTPGFTDSHAHTLQYGHAQQLNLAGSTSVAEVIERLEKYVDENQEAIKGGAWVEGQGWDQTLWEVEEFPTAADFESSPRLRGLPISLQRIDIHAEWISNSILSLLPGLPETVEGGKIMRYSNGSATGVFLDDAMNIIDLVRPQWSEVQMEAFLKQTVDDAVKVGVTGIHDAYGLAEHVEFYQRMAEKGKLPIRFYIMRKCPDKDKYCGDILPMIDNAGDGMLNVKSVKLFADGALGSWGAAMLEPYSDKPEESGIMRTPEEAWMPLIDDFVRNGWQTNAHCIGDRANKVVLDAMEAAIAKYGPADRRLRIEHSQIMTEEDLVRAVRLGVIASYQPTHATSDMWYAKERIGEERLKGAYAWQTYIQLGGRVALGSDFPVESIDPLKGFFAAISRTNEKGESPHGPDGWYPEQKLTREQALKGFTIDAAYASFQENVTGSFKVGKKFDAVVWDRDIMKIEPPTAVLEAKVLSTIVDGKVIYGSLRSKFAKS